MTGALSGTKKRPASMLLCGPCNAKALAANHEADLFALQQHRDRVTETLRKSLNKAGQIDYARLTYTQSFLLYVTLVAADIGPHDHEIPPLNIQTSDLAPTTELSENVYAQLYADGILRPSLSSNPSLFRFSEATGAPSFDIRKVTWALAGDESGRSISTIFSVLFERLEQPEPQAVEDLWYLVAEHECKHYFASQCERYGFHHAAVQAPKVAATIRHYLDRFSIGQLWNIIYYVLKDLAALAQQRTYARQHIYNMIPGAIRRSADYRIANHKAIRPWRRPGPTQQSWMTSVLLDKVLKGGDISFEGFAGQDIFGHVERLLARPLDTARRED